jgi:hypothetical protein
MSSTNQVNTVTTENVVPVGATYDANGNFITLVGAAGAPINTLSGGGTANGVAYLNGSKVLTTGSGLVFDGANLGLGVTPSAWSSYKVLQISGNTAVYSLGSNEIGTVQNAYYNSGWKYGVSSVAASWNYVYQGSTYWQTAPSGTAGNAITFTQAMTLSAAGNLQVPAMYATTVTTPRNVFIDSNGNLGGISSVRASKTNITAIDTANWIYQLNPVTFNYRKKDEEGAFLDEFEKEQQFGLIAEDVETVKPELCIYVDDKLQGVHYDRMIAPIIKAIQEQQVIIQSLTDRVAQLEAK